MIGISIKKFIWKSFWKNPQFQIANGNVKKITAHGTHKSDAAYWLYVLKFKA